MRRLFLSMMAILLGFALPQMVHATPSEMPAQSVTDNSRADTLGIFADTASGQAECWGRLSAGTVRFYDPTDVHAYDPNAKTAPLETSVCARMRVRGGVIGVVALREGALVNLGMRNGREQPVAYNKCNNWLELLTRPVQATATTQPIIRPAPTPVRVQVPQSQATVETHPTTTEHEVVDTVIIKRRTVVRYVDETVYETPPAQTISIPPTQYRYVQLLQPAPVQMGNCINGCYSGPNPNGERIVQCSYPRGGIWCVLISDCTGDRPPEYVVREYQEHPHN